MSPPIAPDVLPVGLPTFVVENAAPIALVGVLLLFLVLVTLRVLAQACAREDQRRRTSREDRS